MPGKMADVVWNLNVMLYKSFLIHIYSVFVSWKNGNNFGKNHGKIMEF